MILKFIENDGVTGARLTVGERPIPDGSFLYRDGRYIRGGELGTIPAFATHRHAGDTLKHVGVNSSSAAFSFATAGPVTFSQLINAASGSKFGNLTLADGSITDSSGAIDFGNENLSTSGNIAILSNASAMIFGAASNAKIEYDNIDLNFDSQLVGAGDFNFKNGSVVLDTGYVDTKAYYYIDGVKTVSADGTNNLFLGELAGESLTTGIDNSIFGYRAGQRLTEGERNMYFGRDAGEFQTTGDYNVFIGYRAGEGDGSPYSAYRNTAIGGLAGVNLASGGNYNMLLGYSAGYNVTTGTTNTMIGYFAGRSVTNNHRSVMIGNFAGYYETSGDRLYIDSRDRTDLATGRISSLIYGKFSATVSSQVLRFNATVQLYQNNLFMTFGAGADSGVRDTGSYMHFDCDLQSAGSRYFQFDNGFLRAGAAIYRRYYHLSINSFNPGASGATWQAADGNQLCGWQLNRDTEDLEFSTDVHAGDWDASSDLDVEIKFSINSAGGAPGDTVDWQLLVYIKGSGDVVTKTQTLLESTTIDADAQYTKYTQHFTIDYDDVGNQVDPGDDICFVLTCEATGDVTDVRVTGASYNYNTTHTGIESGDT